MEAISDDDLLEMSREHIAYEVQMLNYCAFRITATESPEQNLLIEGFALHLRNLIAFLYGKPRQDDVCAEHYLPSGQWETLRGAEPRIMEDAENRAHKQMAHITLSRLRKQKWEVFEITRALVPILKMFVSGARKELIDPNLQLAVEALEKTASGALVKVMVFAGTTSTTTSYSGNLLMPVTVKRDQ